MCKFKTDNYILLHLYSLGTGKSMDIWHITLDQSKDTLVKEAEKVLIFYYDD